MKLFADIGQWGNSRQAFICYGHHNYNEGWKGIVINIWKLHFVFNLVKISDCPRFYIYQS